MGAFGCRILGIVRFIEVGECLLLPEDPGILVIGAELVGSA